MKNVLKKTLATLAALAIMLSVTVIPSDVEDNDNTATPLWDEWDDGSIRY